MSADAHALVLDKYQKGQAQRRQGTSQMVDQPAIFYIIQKSEIYITGITRSSTKMCQPILAFRILFHLIV